MSAMNRRKFLAWMTGTAAGVALAPTLDLERLLWVPGEKAIFLPPAVIVDLDWYRTHILEPALTRIMNRLDDDLLTLSDPLFKPDMAFHVPVPMCDRRDYFGFGG
jgi:hypothetical protein